MAVLAPNKKRTGFLLRVLAPEQRMVISDVGARQTNQVPPYEHLRQLGGCELVGFEPNEAAYKVLVEAGLENATYYQEAVGKPGKGIFYDHPIGSISSLYPISEQAARYLAKYHWINRPELKEIPLTLTGLDKVKGLERIDVLKIDIQGGEYEAIKSGRKVLSKAVAIIPEVSFYNVYEGQPTWRELDGLLHEMGFKMHKLLNSHHAAVGNSQRKGFRHKAHSSQIIDGDMVYVRGADDLGALDDLQLKYLALAADTMFYSFDLTLACLDELARRGVVGEGVAMRYFRKLPDALKMEAN